MRNRRKVEEEHTRRSETMHVSLFFLFLFLLLPYVFFLFLCSLLRLDSWVKPRVWVLLLGIGIATLGYGYTAVLNVSLFSKILEGVDQGTWMGYFNSAGNERKERNKKVAVRDIYIYI